MSTQPEERDMVSVRLDEKGRLTIPSTMRRALEMKPGDTVFCLLSGETISCVKAINPFDILAAHALEEHRRGKTIRLRDITRRQGGQQIGDVT